MKKVKLTPAQEKFLSAINLSGELYAIESWPPVVKLRSIGFIECKKGRWGITVSGIEWLKSNVKIK